MRRSVLLEKLRSGADGQQHFCQIILLFSLNPVILNISDTTFSFCILLPNQKPVIMKPQCNALLITHKGTIYHGITKTTHACVVSLLK
jgi:hypothetical protein